MTPLRFVNPSACPQLLHAFEDGRLPEELAERFGDFDAFAPSSLALSCYAQLPHDLRLVELEPRGDLANQHARRVVVFRQVSAGVRAHDLDAARLKAWTSISLTKAK